MENKRIRKEIDRIFKLLGRKSHVSRNLTYEEYLKLNKKDKLKVNLQLEKEFSKIDDYNYTRFQDRLYNLNRFVETSFGKIENKDDFLNLLTDIEFIEDNSKKGFFRKIGNKLLEFGKKINDTTMVEDIKEDKKNMPLPNKVKEISKKIPLPKDEIPKVPYFDLPKRGKVKEPEEVLEPIEEVLEPVIVEKPKEEIKNYTEEVNKLLSQNNTLLLNSGDNIHYEKNKREPRIKQNIETKKAPIILPEKLDSYEDLKQDTKLVLPGNHNKGIQKNINSEYVGKHLKKENKLDTSNQKETLSLRRQELIKDLENALLRLNFRMNQNYNELRNNELIIKETEQYTTIYDSRIRNTKEYREAMDERNHAINRSEELRTVINREEELYKESKSRLLGLKEVENKNKEISNIEVITNNNEKKTIYLTPSLNIREKIIYDENLKRTK